MCGLRGAHLLFSHLLLAVGMSVILRFLAFVLFSLPSLVVVTRTLAAKCLWVMAES